MGLIHNSDIVVNGLVDCARLCEPHLIWDHKWCALSNILNSFWIIQFVFIEYLLMLIRWVYSLTCLKEMIKSNLKLLCNV